MTKSIDFYFDFISPYSYLAHKKIEIIKEKKGITFNYKPILVGGLHKIQGITAPAFIKTKLNNMINDCNLIAKKNNFNFLWNSKFPLNSLNLLRGYLLINEKVKDLFVNIIFEAYWKDNIDISDKESLTTLIGECKIEKDFFFKEIENKQIKDDLIRLTKEAHNKGIFGVPTFIVNEKIFWGQDRLEYALDEYKK